MTDGDTDARPASVRLCTYAAGEMVVHETPDVVDKTCIHRLQFVAEHGLDALRNGAELEHGNGITWDNRLDNLTWYRAGPASLQTRYDGYEHVVSNVRGETKRVYLHRLLFVAEHGLGDLDSEDHIHHKNGIEWDNRPENLERVAPENFSHNDARQRGKA